MHSPTLVLAAVLSLTVQQLSAQSPQDRLWDAAVAGDTAAIRSAVAAGAKIDSLDRRVSVNGRYALNWAVWHAERSGTGRRGVATTPVVPERFTLRRCNVAWRWLSPRRVAAGPLSPQEAAWQHLPVAE